MMKIIGIILKTAAAAVLSATLCVNAAAAGLEFVLNDDDSVSVSGSAGASLKRNTVTLYITKADRPDNIYVYSGITNADGSFSFNWKPDSSGEYQALAKSGAVAFNDTYWYASVTEYNNILNKLTKGSASDILSVLSDESSMNVIGIEPDSIAGVSAENLAKALYYIREYTDEADRTLDYIPQAMVLAKYYDAPSEETLAELADIFAGLEISLGDYDFYSEITDTAIKNGILERFTKRLLTGIDSADSDFTDSIVLAAVEKCGSWTILDSYLKLLDFEEYNASKYKDSAAMAVAGKSYETREKLTSALSSAIASAKSDSSGDGGGGNGGSGTGSASRPVSFPASITLEDAQEDTEERVVFSDVSESHWAFNAVNYLRWVGIVSGSDFNLFYPDNEVTRAEMTAMLVRTYGLSGGECNFTDVESGAWYYAPIAAAYSRGLVSGDGDAFRPNDAVTRQDMAVMMYRFAAAAGAETASGELTFADSGDIAEYAREAVAAMSAKGIINGVDEEHFAPLATATRAQAAQLIYAACGKGD